MKINKIYQGNCLEVLKTFPNESINCCVTSPPYWGLRDYGVDDQLGLEPTPELYVKKLVKIFREVKRVLRKDGTLWLNLGDSYTGSGKGAATHPKSIINSKQATNKGTHKKTIHSFKNKIYKPKDLIGIPWMVAFALRADGWYLRQDIIWSKPNPMPESVTDRCTKSHEYIFLLSKSKKYYYDNEAISEDTVTKDNLNRDRDSMRLNNTPGRTRMGGLKTNDYDTRNKRSVWTQTTKPYKEAHFAVYPEELIVDCIKAGCPEDGIVLDPFIGSGTTGFVAKKLNRNYIGIELNSEYIKIAKKRIVDEIGLFI